MGRKSVSCEKIVRPLFMGPQSAGELMAVQKHRLGAKSITPEDV
jgi:hypothetical protein